MRHGKIIALVQVAYTIAGAKTRKRELPPLFGVARKAGCRKLLLITDHERETVTEGDVTVEVISAADWIGCGLYVK